MGELHQQVLIRCSIRQPEITTETLLNSGKKRKIENTIYAINKKCNRAYLLLPSFIAKCQLLFMGCLLTVYKRA